MRFSWREHIASDQALTGISGLIFVGLLVAAQRFAGTWPTALTTPPHLVRAFYAVNRTPIGLSTYLAALGLTAFLCFIAGLKRILRRVEREGNILPQLAYTGGLGLALLALVGDLFVATLAFRATSMRTQTAWILFTLWNMALSFMCFPAAILAGATSLVIVRTRILPRWLGVLGFLLVTGLLVAPTSAHHTKGPLVYGGAYWLPLVTAFVFWVLAISVGLVFRPTQMQSERAGREPYLPRHRGTTRPGEHDTRGSKERRTIVRWKRVLLLVMALVCGLAITYSVAGNYVRASLLLAEVSPQIPIKPLSLITPRPYHQVVSFTSAQGLVMADLYLPRRWLGRYQPRSRSALILALGVKAGPSARQTILHFAEAVSRLGYVTLWPRRKSLDRGTSGLEQPATFVAGFQYFQLAKT